MKILISLIFALTLASASAFSLAWDANPATDQVTSYNVYERVGTAYNLLGTVNSPTTTFTLPNPSAGIHYYALTANNTRGESPKSPEAILPAAPQAPTGLKITNP